MTQPKKKRKWPRVMLIVLLGCLIVYGVVLAFVYHATFVDYPDQRADTAIILGARVMPSGGMSTTLEHRAEVGLQAYEQDLVGKIIVCGGQGGDEPMTEARAMADYLIQKGVPEGDIFLDERSTDTIENMENAKAIMEENNLETALVVTSDYHLKRALWLAEDQDIEAYGRPAPGPNTRGKKLEGWLRETLSWINYWVRYRLFGG